MSAPHDNAAQEAAPTPDSVETRRSWVTAWIVVGIISISYAAPFPMVIALKVLQSALGSDRSVVALAGALVWVGTGAGGILMGWLADRIGIRPTVAIGAVMMATGLAICTIGQVWALALGNLVFIGALGNGAIYAPLLIYVSRWFDRRRGTAIALISSGQYVAGVVWPSVFQAWMERFGWQAMFLLFAAVVVVAILPLLAFLGQAPDMPVTGRVEVVQRGTSVLGLQRTVAQTLICIAAFLWSVTLAVPTGHLVAFCTDIGIPATHGAAMLSVLLGSAFFTRPLWGWFADHFGGLRTILIGSLFQAAAIAAFLVTHTEIGLFIVASAFGLGFSGILPSYSLSIRDLYPSGEASWRIPTVLFTAMSGLAFGGWFSGFLYDRFGEYGPAFKMAIAANLLSLVVVGFLVSRLPHGRSSNVAAEGAQ